MTVRRWSPVAVDTVFEHPLLGLEVRRVGVDDGEETRKALVLRAPDWVNVIPRLPDGRLVLVRQWRHGIEAPTLEIPGGVVEPGEDARDAAARELLEETGYRVGSLERLGEVTPNPAILSNRCPTFLAEGLERVGEPEGDGEEEIELVYVAEDRIPELIREGAIHHALVVAAFHLLALSGR